MLCLEPHASMSDLLQLLDITGIREQLLNVHIAAMSARVCICCHRCSIRSHPWVACHKLWRTQMHGVDEAAPAQFRWLLQTLCWRFSSPPVASYTA